MGGPSSSSAASLDFSVGLRFRIGFFTGLIARLTCFRANSTAMSSFLSFLSAGALRVCARSQWVFCFNPSLVVLRSFSGLFSCQTRFFDFCCPARKWASQFTGAIHLTAHLSKLISIFGIQVALIRSRNGSFSRVKKQDLGLWFPVVVIRKLHLLILFVRQFCLVRIWSPWGTESGLCVCSHAPLYPIGFRSLLVVMLISRPLVHSLMSRLLDVLLFKMIQTFVPAALGGLTFGIL
jgi:hypothetical protein